MSVPVTEVPLLPIDAIDASDMPRSRAEPTFWPRSVTDLTVRVPASIRKARDSISSPLDQRPPRKSRWTSPEFLLYSAVVVWAVWNMCACAKRISQRAIARVDWR